MDSPFEDASLHPSKCSNMSVDQKRELIYELSKNSFAASEVLLSWSRQEILQILCAEMGKERKYTGLTKVKIIEALLKIVSEKRSGDHEATEALGQRNSKRQRKTDKPSHLTIPTTYASGSTNSMNSSGNSTIYCKNLACKATLRQEDKFCKRCSCCICCLYDDNKDPSLWLTCSSESPFLGDSCGMSCHLECALKNVKSGIGKDRWNTALDGSFYCVSCGKENDLLGCWRKQLTVAKDTRRVDILCYRLSLAQKLLKGTKKYQKLCGVVAEAVEKLEAEVGLLTGLPVKMGRGIVNRLHSGQQVQKLCSLALESLDKLLSCTEGCSSGSDNGKSPDSVRTNSTKVRFENIRATSITVTLGSDESSPGNIVHYSLWHRKVTDKDYPAKSTCTLFTPNTRFVVSGLTPATEFSFKVVSFSGTRELGTNEIKISTQSTEEDEAANCPVMERSESPVTNCSSLSNPSSVEDESNNIATQYSSDNYNSYCKEETEKNIASANVSNDNSALNKGDATNIVSLEPDSDVLEIEKDRSLENQIAAEMIPDTPCGNNISDTGLLVTQVASDRIKNGQARNGKSKSSNKDDTENFEKGGNGGQNGECSGNRVSDTDFEHCVKVVRQLECLGYIEKAFRQKFLTWYSLRATQQEIRVVKVFIDTFMDDQTALAEQLLDTFSDCVSSKRSTATVVPAGFCMKLWH